MNFYRLGKTLLLAGALTFLLQGCAQFSRISYLAKDEKNLTEVSDAIDKGADIDSCSDVSHSAGTALINASVAGNEKMVSMLVKKGAHLTKGCWTIYGNLQPPLSEASARGHLGVMHILLSHGANPRVYSVLESTKRSDRLAFTAIWAATKANQYAAVKALLTYDESLASDSVKFGKSMGRISELGTILPVHYAVYKGYDEVAALLSLSSSGHMRTSNGYGLDDVIKKREMHIAEAERTAERNRENSRKDNAFGIALGMAALGVGAGLDGRTAGNLGIAAGRDYRDGTTSNTASFMANTAAKMRDFNAQVERERQAKSLQDQQRLQKPTLYQQQLNRIAGQSNGNNMKANSSVNMAASNSAKSRAPQSTSSGSTGDSCSQYQEFKGDKVLPQVHTAKAKAKDKITSEWAVRTATWNKALGDARKTCRGITGKGNFGMIGSEADASCTKMPSPKLSSGETWECTIAVEHYCDCVSTHGGSAR